MAVYQIELSCRNIDKESFLYLANTKSLQSAKGVDCERLLFFFKGSETRDEVSARVA